MQNGKESMYSKRAPHMPSIALVILIIVIIAKNGMKGFTCTFHVFDTPSTEKCLKHHIKRYVQHAIRDIV